MQALSEVDTLVIDKTGTLTRGKPVITDIATLAGLDENDALRMAASLEAGSEHPLAAAFLAAARERKLKIRAAAEFTATAGHGVSGRVERSAVATARAALGNRAQLESLAIAPGPLEAQAQKFSESGKTVAWLSLDGAVAALFALAEPLRPEAAESLRKLQTAGMTVTMLTGDQPGPAAAIAAAAGLANWKAGLSPSAKREEVAALQRAGHRVTMAGDGINDAPALAQADCGIAMGGGADVALQTAGLALVNGDLRALLRAVKLSRAVMRNIRENLAFAFLYNALGIPLAAGALYPLLGMTLSPMIAAAAMTFSLSVILNTLRLRRIAL